MSIGSSPGKFNSTAIQEGGTIWFNGHLKVSGLGSTPATVYFDHSTINFVANGVPYTLPVADGQVTLSSANTSTSTTYDAAADTWLTTVSPANFGKNVFVTGLAFPVPTGGLPGGITPVTWQGRFRTDTPGLTVSWQWGAAVYTTDLSDYNALGVKPVDGDKENPYRNSDHVGAPENIKPFDGGRNR